MDTAGRLMLRRGEASTYLLENYGVNRTPNTLAKYKSQGIGPEIEYLGRIPFYRIAKLDAWVRTQLTSEPRSLSSPLPATSATA